MNGISHDQASRRFTTTVDGHRAELDYTISGRIMNITHTLVPTEIGGQGIAAELMHAAVAVAGQAGWSINPLCSYAVAYMRKHPLLAGEGHLD